MIRYWNWNCNTIFKSSKSKLIQLLSSQSMRNFTFWLNILRILKWAERGFTANLPQPKAAGFRKKERDLTKSLLMFFVIYSKTLLVTPREVSMETLRRVTCLQERKQICSASADGLITWPIHIESVFTNFNPWGQNRPFYRPKPISHFSQNNSTQKRYFEKQKKWQRYFFMADLTMYSSQT